MGVQSGNPTWQNFPSTATPISADALNNIEDALDTIATTAGAPGPAGPAGPAGADGADGADATITPYATRSAFPATGVANKLYVALAP